MQDTRIRRAKRALKDADEQAEDARVVASSRSTGTRTAYKIKADAADRALEILEEPKPR